MAAARTRRKRPLEYSLLYTATLCLFAAGAVMVYSASSAESLLQGPGDPSYYLKRYLFCGAIGLVVLHLLSRHGLEVVKTATPLLLVAAFFLTLMVMVPGAGVSANGATRWLGAGPLQFQPSELLKLALVLYAAQLLAARPRGTKTLGGLTKPLLLVIGGACVLLMLQPDMGTTLVICFAIFSLLIAAGTPIRLLGSIFGTLAFLALIVALIEPYRRARLTSFVDPFSDAGGAGFQAVQALTAIGSGGFFGVGLGAEDLLFAGGPHRHDPGDHRRGARPVRPLRGDRALRDDRLRRAADREAGPRPLLQAAGGRDHLAGPVAGIAQLLRGAGDGAAHRRAAALHLLRQHQPDRAHGRHGPAPERRGHGRPGIGALAAAAHGDRGRPRWRRS
jgi:hypothetical protein